MKPASQTTIFGIRMKLDPKILVGGIILLAGFLFWYNSRGDDEGPSTAAAVRPVAPAAAPMPKSHIATVRRGTTANNDRGTLRLRPVDATRGNVDPTLRLELLSRLQSEDEVPTGRSLFEAGPTPAEVAAANLTRITGPKIPPQPLPPTAPVVPAGPAPLNIPLKFYGFVKPTDNREASRGFFMDGDNVLVAAEGQVLKQKYRVMELTAKAARLEDIQLKQSETLQVVPEAMTP
ncbi:MAG TPA: hypothetical protein VMF91_17225 [Bryobacteraceae bacterium]|nr:hypothetical protein [Bryobacteraceae bacterium]